jgi:hypothetical protein
MNEDELNHLIDYPFCKDCIHGPNKKNDCLSSCQEAYHLLKVGFKKNKTGKY